MNCEILTDENGRPIEKPSPRDYMTPSEYVRAFHAYQDKIAAVANAAFDAAFRREMGKR